MKARAKMESKFCPECNGILRFDDALLSRSREYYCEKCDKYFSTETLTENQLKKRIAELEAELAQLKKSKSYVVGIETADGYLEGIDRCRGCITPETDELGIACDNCFDGSLYSGYSPVAKPIEVDGYGNPFIAFSGWKIVFKEGLKRNRLYVIAESKAIDGLDSAIEIGQIENVADKLQAAQEWLNKLVADMSIASTCPENVSKNGEDLKVSENSEIPNNPTCKEILQVPQFTAEEIDGIRKLAQFSGFMIANSIIAKCEAMLEGADK